MPVGCAIRLAALGVKPARGRAVDVVADHADVVGGGRPAQLRVGERAGRRQVRRRGRRLRRRRRRRGWFMSPWISAARQRAVVDADLVDQPAKYSPQIVLPPIRSAPVEVGDRPRVWAFWPTCVPLTKNRSVRAVVGRGEVRPDVERERRRAGDGLVAPPMLTSAVGTFVLACRGRRGRRPSRRAAPSAARCARRRRARSACTHASWVIPVVRSSEPESGTVTRLGAVEAERAAEPAAGRPGRAGDRAVCCPLPDRSGSVVPGALVHAVGGHEAGRAQRQRLGPERRLERVRSVRRGSRKGGRDCDHHCRDESSEAADPWTLRPPSRVGRASIPHATHHRWAPARGLAGQWSSLAAR